MKTVSRILVVVTSIVSFACLRLDSILISNLYADNQATDSSKGTVIADSGFRPKPGGFSFENWGGDQYPHSDLTANDAVVLFGERVCARWQGDTCVPTPATKTWLNEMNQMMKGGHCEGMAALSAAFHIKQEKPSEYGGKQAFELTPKDRTLMATISTYFATQALEPVQSKTALTREWPLQKIVDFIVEELKAGRDYPTLGIYGDAGGHAITPYLVEQRGPGEYRMYVYDNNYPGAEKWVDINIAKDHWVYAGAALNPKEDAAPWEGGTGAMDVTLLSTRYEPLACPFCGTHKPPRAPAKPPAPSARPRSPSVQSDSYSIITPNRCSQVQATRKKDKKQLSTGKDGEKREIPGATMSSLRGTRGCYVRLPANEQYSVSLVDDGRPVNAPATNLFIFGSGTAYGVSNIALSSGTVQTFSLGQSGFSYQAGGNQKPTLIVATDTGRPNAYYEVNGFTLTNGFQFNAEMSPSGAISFSDNDPALDSFDVKGEISSESGDEDVDLVDLESGDKGTLELEVEDDGDLDVDIDSDSDGIEDEKDTDDDNDGTADAQDTDDDNDGTLDAQEKEDSDHDGTADDQDTDDDNDGTPDAQDTDDDNDGTLDAQEKEDSDHDGTADDQDTDDDNDGTPDAQDTDDDNDGTLDAQEKEDSDHDGTADDQDTDDDNDGTSDAQDTDDDNDGTLDAQEKEDSDHDGTADDQDTDDDNDGTADAQDTDDDNDGTPDAQEEEDSDHDGTADTEDTDDDNDGTADAQDTDDDNDGTADAQDTDDDNDGTADAQDTDDGNDGSANAQEDEVADTSESQADDDDA